MTIQTEAIRLFKLLLATLLAPALVLGCGLGTEVGNGAKPEKEKEDRSASKKSGENESGTPTGSQDDILSEDSKNGDDGDGGGEESDNLGGNVSNSDTSTTPLPAGDFDFDIKLLLNDCASPFEAIYDKKIALGAKNSAGKQSKISGTFDQSTATWTLKDAFGKVVASVSDDEVAADYAVTVKNSNNVTLTQEYTCSQVSGGQSTNGYTYTANLEKNGVTSVLTWTVAPGTPSKLLQITVKPNADAATVIKLDPIKN